MTDSTVALQKLEISPKKPERTHADEFLDLLTVSNARNIRLMGGPRFDVANGNLMELNQKMLTFLENAKQTKIEESPEFLQSKQQNKDLQAKYEASLKIIGAQELELRSLKDLVKNGPHSLTKLESENILLKDNLLNLHNSLDSVEVYLKDAKLESREKDKKIRKLEKTMVQIMKSRENPTWLAALQKKSWDQCEKQKVPLASEAPEASEVPEASEPPKLEKAPVERQPSVSESDGEDDFSSMASDLSEMGLTGNIPK